MPVGVVDEVLEATVTVLCTAVPMGAVVMVVLLPFWMALVIVGAVSARAIRAAPATIAAKARKVATTPEETRENVRVFMIIFYLINNFKMNERPHCGPCHSVLMMTWGLDERYIFLFTATL